MKTGRCFIATIKSRQCSLVGYLSMEENGMERQTPGTEIGEKRARGRPRMIVLDWMEKAMRVTELKTDRKKWEKKTALISSTA